MARYIDADKLIEMLNNKTKLDLEMGLYNHGALTQSFIKFVERQPTADVAPKSEAHDDHHKQVACYTLGCREGDKIKREAAREIFDWIERSMVIYNPEIPGLRSISMNVFNALKKKYTEADK